MPETLAAPSRDRLLRVSQRLPTSPAVLTRLQDLLADPNSGLEDICELLKRDMTLAARVLRNSNSPYYAPAEPHTSLEEAVGCVGYKEIYKVVSLTVASQIFNYDLAVYGYPADLLWENILCCALATESLAQFAGTNPRAAYTAGLMRSLGKVILDRIGAEAKPPAAFAASAGEPLPAWERRTLGWDNAAVGGLLLREWKFGEETCAAVERQYQPGEAPAANLLAIAGRVAAELGHGLPGEETCWEPADEKLRAAGIETRDLELCRAETKAGLESVRQMLR